MLKGTLGPLALPLYIALVASLFSLAMSLFSLVSACAGAQRDADDPGLLLARTCVSERSWAVDTDDCAAIHAVAARRVEVRGGTLAEALRVLSPTLHGEGELRRPWIRHLERDGRRPRAWRRASWARHRPLWLATLAEADALVAGERTHRCAEMPSSWGSRVDVRVALARDPSLRWVEITCGTTANLFGRWERRVRD